MRLLFVRPPPPPPQKKKLSYGNYPPGMYLHGGSPIFAFTVNQITLRLYGYLSWPVTYYNEASLWCKWSYAYVVTQVQMLGGV